MSLSQNGRALTKLRVTSSMVSDRARPSKSHNPMEMPTVGKTLQCWSRHTSAHSGTPHYLDSRDVFLSYILLRLLQRRSKPRIRLGAPAEQAIPTAVAALAARLSEAVGSVLTVSMQGMTGIKFIRGPPLGQNMAKERICEPSLLWEPRPVMITRSPGTRPKARNSNRLIDSTLLLTGLPNSPLEFLQIPSSVNRLLRKTGKFMRLNQKKT